MYFSKHSFSKFCLTKKYLTKNKTFSYTPVIICTQAPQLMILEGTLNIWNSVTIDRGLIHRAEIVTCFAIIEGRNYCEYFNTQLRTQKERG
jgi:hypothetical protein